MWRNFRCLLQTRDLRMMSYTSRDLEIPQRTSKHSRHRGRTQAHVHDSNIRLRASAHSQAHSGIVHADAKSKVQIPRGIGNGRTGQRLAPESFAGVGETEGNNSNKFKLNHLQPSPSPTKHQPAAPGSKPHRQCINFKSRV